MLRGDGLAPSAGLDRGRCLAAPARCSADRASPRRPAGPGRLLRGRITRPGPQGGSRWTLTRRPCPPRLQAPPDRRPPRNPARRLPRWREPPRRHPAPPAALRRPTGSRATRAPPSKAPAPVRRPGLRPKEDDSGRSSTSSWGIQSLDGRGRSAGCLHTPPDTNCATASAVRPRLPPCGRASRPATIAAPAPHHSLAPFCRLLDRRQRPRQSGRGPGGGLFRQRPVRVTQPRIHPHAPSVPGDPQAAPKIRCGCHPRPGGAGPARPTYGCRAAGCRARLPAGGRRRWPAGGRPPRRTPGPAGSPDC